MTAPRATFFHVQQHLSPDPKHKEINSWRRTKFCDKQHQHSTADLPQREVLGLPVYTLVHHALYMAILAFCLSVP